MPAQREQQGNGGSVEDDFRGRVFSVYDVFYNLARVVAAALAIPLLGELHVPTSLAVIGVAFVLWAPVVMRWYGREPELRLRFYAGGRADEVPRSIVWGGAEEPVDVLRTWHDERDGRRRLAFRLALGDGTVLDVSRPEPDGPWRLDREGERPLPTPDPPPQAPSGRPCSGSRKAGRCARCSPPPIRKRRWRW